MITYQVEKLNDCLEEMKPLLKAHYHEIAMYQDKIDLNPDYGIYHVMDEHGKLFIVTCRDDERLIGYSIYFIKEHLHYKDHIYAMNDIIFLHPKNRGGTEAAEMLSLAESELKELGVSVITMHMKVYAPFESLMGCLEFDKAEYLFSKYIGD